MRTDKVKEKLQALYADYTKNLPYKIDKISSTWSELLNYWDQKKFEDFHRDIHSLAGSAGTYGYTALGESARKFEIYLKSVLNSSKLSSAQQDEISYLLNQLTETFIKAVPENQSHLDLNPVKVAKNNSVFILDRDEKFFIDIEKSINLSGYKLCRITTVSMLTEAMQSKPPVVLIVDVQYIDDEEMQIFQKQEISAIPLICIADNGDILTRLKAVRMGCKAFLQKPIDEFYLIKTLDQLCGISPFEPYRILIVDDSRSLSEYFSLILEQAEMITRVINNPLYLIEVIEEFQPDLILMDVFMPDCTGLELAAVLRQENLYTRIPIIFLSTEADRLKQLSALNLGGDDFLTKPILPEHLIEAVKSRAKRAGILSSFMMRDSLTGLLNHTNILQRLDIEISRAKRQSESLSFVMIDIDHFKNVNDSYGHVIGDKVIRMLSSILSTVLRKTDISGRYGGEEFAVIFPHTDGNSAVKICNDLRKKFSQISFTSNNEQFNVTISLGIASYPYLQDANTLVLSADLALYKAKHNGRNQVVMFELS